MTESFKALARLSTRPTKPSKTVNSRRGSDSRMSNGSADVAKEKSVNNNKVVGKKPMGFINKLKKSRIAS